MSGPRLQAPWRTICLRPSMRSCFGPSNAIRVRDTRPLATSRPHSKSWRLGLLGGVRRGGAGPRDAHDGGVIAAGRPSAQWPRPRGRQRCRTVPARSDRPRRARRWAADRPRGTSHRTGSLPTSRIRSACTSTGWGIRTARDRNARIARKTWARRWRGRRRDREATRVGHRGRATVYIRGQPDTNAHATRHQRRRQPRHRRHQLPRRRPHRAPEPSPTRKPAPAPTRGPQVTPRPAPGLPARDPAETVGRFYRLVVEERFDDAAALWTAKMRQRYPPEGDMDGRFAPTTDIDLQRNEIVAFDPDAGAATVAVGHHRISRVGAVTASLRRRLGPRARRRPVADGDPDF